MRPALAPPPNNARDSKRVPVRLRCPDHARSPYWHRDILVTLPVSALAEPDRGEIRYECRCGRKMGALK
jgi:hypothetical protein